MKMHDTLVITGASRGIGYATATLFQQQGWHVINLSRKPCKLAGVTNLAVDLSVAGWEHSVSAELVEKVKHSARVCLVHNAAVYHHDAIDNLSPAQWRSILEANTVAPLILNQLLLPHMQSGSAIIYIGSTLSEMAVKNTASYTTTKHAIVGLMRATCQDLEGKGITTACICPGFTDTEMMREHIGNNASTLSAIKDLTSFKRLLEPDEIAEVILFSATNPALNGSVVHANLGQIRR